MAKNFVESHIQEGAFHSFYVEAGQVVKIGELVEITANGKVQKASAGSQKVVGQVYSGTVGVDGRNTGYSGDENMVVTVVVLKPFVYVLAEGALNAGDMLEAGANGGVVAHTSTATFEAGEYNKVIGMALEAGASGERVRALLK